MDVDLPSLAYEYPGALQLLDTNYEWHVYPHLEYAYDRLMWALLDEDGPQAISLEMPPQHYKSTTAAYFTAWAIARFGLDTIYGTHTAGKAKERGGFIRDVFRRQGPRVFDAELKGDTKAKDRWKTSNGGHFFSSGVKGAEQGEGADLYVIDDPISSPADYKSKANRQQRRDWYRGTMMTRRREGAVIVFIMQRWGENDLLGWAMSESELNWHRVRLPALAEKNDPLGRDPGEALCPQAYSRGWLLTQREEVNQFWAAEYQQDPEEQTGGKWSEDLFEYYDVEETEDGLVLVCERRGETLRKPVDDLRRISILDSAEGGEDESASESAITTWLYEICDPPRADATQRPVNMWLWHVASTHAGDVGKYEAFESTEDLARTCIQRNSTKLHIEDGGFGAAIADTLGGEGLPVELFPASGYGSKEDRAEWLLARYRASRAWHPKPERAPWLDAFEDQLVQFPAGEHEDMADSGFWAAIRLAQLAEDAAQEFSPDAVWTA